MKYRITEHGDIDSLEFELLEEMPKLRVLFSLITDDKIEEKNEFIRKIENTLEKVTRVNRVFEVIHKKEDGCICLNNRLVKPLLFIENTNMEVGEIYFESDGRYNDEYHVVKVNDELIDTLKIKDFFGEMDKWVKEKIEDSWGRYSRRYNDNLIQANKLEEGEINFKVITEMFEEHKKDNLEQEKANIEAKKKEVKEKEISEGQDKVDYDSKGEGDFGRFSVENKTIKIQKKEYILNKNVNKTFPYEEIKSAGDSGYGTTILDVAEIFLNDKNTSYTKKMDSGKSYKVSYVKSRCQINGAYVPSAKIRFILNRIFNKGATKEEIQILTKLNGMKMDFVGLECIMRNYGDDLKIPIVNKAIDDKTFEIEFLGKKKTFDWDEIKDKFFSGGSSRSVDYIFRNDKLLRFCGEMGVEKKELFRMMKRIKMLNALKNEDNK